MRTVGGEDGRAHVTADLCSAERACLATACLALQRGNAAVPPTMPLAHHLASALDCMAARERGKAASGVVWSVLKEDVVLGLGAEVWHGCVESEPAEVTAAERAGGLDGTKNGRSDTELTHT
jgi:hypothetical protein